MKENKIMFNQTVSEHILVFWIYDSAAVTESYLKNFWIFSCKCEII